jgi:hypothetical protein
MAIFDFDTFKTEDLKRIIGMNTELEEMGLVGMLDEDMIAEARVELEMRDGTLHLT